MGLYKQGNVWYMQYKDVDGRWVRESTKKKLKNEAQAALRKRESEILGGEYWSSGARRIKFNDAADQYLAHEANTRKKPSSLRGDRGRLKFLRPYFGEMPLAKITPRDIQAYIEKRKKTVKGATCNRDLACLKHIFTVSRKTLGFRGFNPVSEVEFFPEQSRDYTLTKEETRRLLEAAGRFSPILRPIIIIALNTAMRLMEILSLRWDFIDFENRVISLPPGNTKNGKRRLVPMNALVEEVLQGIRRDSDFVFPSTDSRTGHIQSIKRAFETARKNAGLPEFRFHDLKHCAGTHLAMKTDLFSLREIMGHADIRTTQGYVNAANATQLAAVDALTADNSWMLSAGKRAEPEDSCHNLVIVGQNPTPAPISRN